MEHLERVEMGLVLSSDAFTEVICVKLRAGVSSTLAKRVALGSANCSL
jgi:hypothetical protein